MREPSDGTVGDLAIVLHSHMPYVEGFGTYPFGEEWLFDAIIRSYLPVLEVARHLTVTVTPVLADQLEDPGVQLRLRDFLVDYRIAAAKDDLADVPPECRQAAKAEAERYQRALASLDSIGGDPLRAFQEAERDGRVAIMASAATHAVLPLLATRQGLRLQLDAGLRSHRRRFDWQGGFWLPECAYAPGLEWELAAHGVRWFCVDQSREAGGPDSLCPVQTDAGPVAFPIDWETISRVWALDGYPSHPAHAMFMGKSLRGTQIWKVGGGAYDPEAATAAAREQAGLFVEAVADRLATYREARGRRGLLVFAIDTELLGHWWSEGPVWLDRVIDRAAAGGLRLVTLREALDAHPPEGGRLAPASWGDGKDLRSWDSPGVADIAWAARRLELRLLAAVECGLERGAALRSARELLAAQSSDWAFLDGKGQAGDYPFQRATAHAQAMLEAIDSSAVPDPRMRALAPDLSLAPILEP
jgi:1,4-alpha-glucan branching enzyme